MKLRHLILFIIACAVLILAELPGGSLLALSVWLQIYNLLVQKEFSKRSQRWAFFLFLIALPFVFFWGSIHSFLFVYLHEKQILFSMMAASIDICLCLIGAVYFSFAFEVAESAQFQVNASLKRAFAEIKIKKAAFFLRPFSWVSLRFLRAPFPCPQVNAVPPGDGPLSH